MKKKCNFTPEQRAASAARLKALWQDPEFQRKRAAAVQAAVERNRRDGRANEKRSATMKAIWADPGARAKRKAAARKKAESEAGRKQAALFAELRSDPEFQRKRLKRLKEYSAKSASAIKARLSANNTKRRGFAVPARLWWEYCFLRKSKKLLAREAGVALGLVRAE